MTSIIPGLFAPGTQPSAGTVKGSIKATLDGAPGTGSYSATTTAYDGVTFTEVSYTDATGRSGHYTAMTKRDANGRLESQSAGIGADGRSFFEDDSQTVDGTGRDHDVTTTFSEGQSTGEDRSLVHQSDGSWRFTGAYYTSAGDWGTVVGGLRTADGTTQFAERIQSGKFGTDTILTLALQV